jgi:hypothetical protein
MKVKMGNVTVRFQVTVYDDLNSTATQRTLYETIFKSVKIYFNFRRK